jgi:Ca2+-binding EF-hand superfamily protein
MLTSRTLSGVRLGAVLAAVLASASLAAEQNGQGRARDDGQGRGGSAQIRFQAMDTDHDGVITRAEWRGSDEAFRQQDTNHDGVLSGAEVARTPAAEGRGRQRADLLAQFARADRDGDRRLRRNEWTLDLGSFEQADANGDGMVTRAEFLDARRAAPSTSDAAMGTTADLRRGTPAFQTGFDKGLVDGRQAGKEDRTINGGKWDLEGQRELEQADAGYQASVGARVDYQAGYRAGFRRGYTEGFGPR